MPSERQILANTLNGRKGGPKTEAGKQKSRLNSLKHGLCSRALVVLPEEDQREYNEVLRGFRASFEPQSQIEDALVQRLAQTHWRTLRSRCVETDMLNVSANAQRAEAREIVEDCPEQLSPHSAIAVSFLNSSVEKWQTFLRYDTTISRDFFKTVDTLMRMQRARQLSKPSKPLVLSASGATPAPIFEAVSDSGIRFVSQTSTPVSVSESSKELTHESKEQQSK